MDITVSFSGTALARLGIQSRGHTDGPWARCRVRWPSSPRDALWMRAPHPVSNCRVGPHDLQAIWGLGKAERLRRNAVFLAHEFRRCGGAKLM